MLIYRKKGMNTPWVGLSKKSFFKLKKYLTKYRHVYLYWGSELEEVFFYGKDEFFTNITPDIIKEEFKCLIDLI
jgi:hypothetical protein